MANQWDSVGPDCGRGLAHCVHRPTVRVAVQITLALLVAVLLALIPSQQLSANVKLAQQNTLLEVRLDPPIAGVRICWQTRCYETDSIGRWKHTVTVNAGQWYELVITDGSATIEGLRIPSGMYAQKSADNKVKFQFSAAPPANTGPLTLYVIAAAPEPTPTATARPTVGPSPTPGPTATPTEAPPWDPDKPLPYEVRAAIEQAALEAMYNRLAPPVTLYELVTSPVWAVANTHSGLLNVWCADPTAEQGRSSNWRIAPGAPLSRPFTVETPIGEIECIAFANGIYCRLGMQYYALQWGGFALARLSPSMVWEVEE